MNALTSTALQKLIGSNGSLCASQRKQPDLSLDEFLARLPDVTKPEYREMIASICSIYQGQGWITAKQARMPSAEPRHSPGWKMPTDLVAGDPDEGAITIRPGEAQMVSSIRTWR